MRKQNPNLGCIDPHGVWPFPKDRESCPKCQAIRAQARRRRGLRYGWWKSADFWTATLSILGLGLAMFLLFGAWFMDWKPWW